jgi:hypothetical protein
MLRKVQFTDKKRGRRTEMLPRFSGAGGSRYDQNGAARRWLQRGLALMSGEDILRFIALTIEADVTQGPVYG